MAWWSELTNAPINEDNKQLNNQKDESNSTTRGIRLKERGLCHEHMHDDVTTHYRQ